jgi:hypothetical protein
MKEKLEEFLKYKEQLTEELKTFVQNKSNDLDLRWQLFCDSKLGEHKGWYAEFKNVSSDDYYDRYNLDKYSVGNVEDILERALDHKYITDEEAIEFKEDVLSQFIYSFTYDW